MHTFLTIKSNLLTFLIFLEKIKYKANVNYKTIKLFINHSERINYLFVKALRESIFYLFVALSCKWNFILFLKVDKNFKATRFSFYTCKLLFLIKNIKD